tara:strand:+ start:2040 stop:2195 length:156 start_codon:yes stop_codon:yes gene_type:complete
MKENEIGVLFSNILARLDKTIAKSKLAQKELIAELKEIEKEREENIKKCLR